MKILQINSVCGKSSTGRIASDLAEQIINNNGDARICFGRDSAVGWSKSISYKIGLFANVYLHTAIVRLFDLEEFASVLSTIKLCRFIKSYNPDIVHLHNIHGYYLNYNLLFFFLERMKKPVIWTLHDCWTFTGHCSHFENNNCYKWKEGCHNCKFKNRYPRSLFFNFSAFHLKNKKKAFTRVSNMTLITPSEWLRNYVKASYLGKYHCEVINNGVDRKIFQVKTIPQDFLSIYSLEGKKIVLGVSTLWDKGKGLDDFNQLSEKLPDEFRIVLIGVDRTTKQKLNKKIYPIERTNNTEELATWYNASYVFVNPTYEDNFPTVNIEALSCGTPVIGYDTGGSPESINQAHGIVIEKGNINGLAKAIIESHFTDADREFCVKQSAQYDTSVMHSKYLAVYNQLLRNNK